jgi:hypothetical protein
MTKQLTHGRLNYMIKDLTQLQNWLLRDDNDVNISSTGVISVQNNFNQLFSVLTRELDDYHTKQIALKSADRISSVYTKQECRKLLIGIREKITKLEVLAKTPTEKAKLTHAKNILDRITTSHDDTEFMQKARRYRERRQLARERYANLASNRDVIVEMTDTPNTHSLQEQKFFEEKKETDVKLDEYYDIISKGLTELREIANNISDNVDYQIVTITEVDNKTDELLDKFASSNNKLVQLLEDHNITPCIICTVVILVTILLALIIYILR